MYGSLSGFSSFCHQINFVAHRNWIFFGMNTHFFFKHQLDFYRHSLWSYQSHLLPLLVTFIQFRCSFFPSFFFSGIKFKFGVLWIVVESSKIDRDFKIHREYWHQPKWVHDTDKILSHVTEKCKHPTKYFVNVINFKLSHK